MTHAHYDHISGLAGFFLARSNSRGDKEKPVTVYYPAGAEAAFSSFRTLVDQIASHRTFKLEWHALLPAEQVAMKKLVVEPFATLHDTPSYGYRFFEQRSRLKLEYRTCSQQEIQNLKSAGIDFHESYSHIVLAFTGDTGPGLDPALFQNADVLVHEATFMRAEDREGLFHSTAEEAIRLAMDACVKTLIIYHISHRYDRQEIKRTVTALQDSIGFNGRISVIAGFTHKDGFYH